MRPLDNTDIAMRSFELFDMLSVDRTGPYKGSPAHITMDTRNDYLSCFYGETYEIDRIQGSHIASHVSMWDFDENNIDHQYELSQAMYKLNRILYPKTSYKEQLVSFLSAVIEKSEGESKKKFIKYYKDVLDRPASEFVDRPFYYKKLMSYDSRHKTKLKQIISVDVFRGTLCNLIELPFKKWYFLEMSVTTQTGGYDYLGRIVVNVHEGIYGDMRMQMIEDDIRRNADTIQKHNFDKDRAKRIMEFARDETRYDEMRFIEVLRLSPAMKLDSEEIEKLSGLVNDYGFGLRLRDSATDPKETHWEITLGELIEKLS